MTTKNKKPSITYLVVRADGESIPYEFPFKADAERVAKSLNENSKPDARLYGVIEIKK